MGGEHTFVVPAFGRSPHLRACLKSLHQQTVPSAVIVSTTTPYDGLDALVAEQGGELVIHQGAPGIGRDWNRALACARTPWVTIAHQDDLYLPNFSARTLGLAQALTDASMIFTGYAELLGESRRSGSVMLNIKRLLLEIGFLGRACAPSVRARRRILRFGCPIPCPAVTLHVRNFDFRFREDMRVNLDWEAWSRLADMSGSFGYCREVLMLHRIHQQSETSAGVREGVRAKEDLLMFEGYWPRPVAAYLAQLYALSYRENHD